MFPEIALARGGKNPKPGDLEMKVSRIEFRTQFPFVFSPYPVCYMNTTLHPQPDRVDFSSGP